METLLFVYNAKSDFWSKKLDFAHKIISPSTYNCNLCALTHHNFGETEIWKNFRENSGITMEFIYKNEFEQQYPNFKNTTYPIVFKKNKAHQLSVFMPSESLSEMRKIEDLIQKIKSKLLL